MMNFKSDSCHLHPSGTTPGWHDDSTASLNAARPCTPKPPPPLPTPPLPLPPTPLPRPSRSGYGAPITVVELDKPDAAANIKSYLWDKYNISGRYSAIAMHPDVESLGMMTKQQVGVRISHRLVKTAYRQLRG